MHFENLFYFLIIKYAHYLLELIFSDKNIV